MHVERLSVEKRQLNCIFIRRKVGNEELADKRSKLGNQILGQYLFLVAAFRNFNLRMFVYVFHNLYLTSFILVYVYYIIYIFSMQQ